MHTFYHSLYIRSIRFHSRHSAYRDLIHIRSLSTNRVLDQRESKSGHHDNTSTSVKKGSSSDVPEKKRRDTSDLEEYKMPDDNPEIPKKHVFQQLNTIKLNDPIYTLEEAARPAPIDSRTRYYKYPSLFQQLGYTEYSHRSWDNRYSFISQFPDLSDYVIVGSGLVGSATAYYSKKVCSRTIDILVIDKDPYSPHCTTAFSSGLLSCQSKSRDVSRLAILSKELIRNLKRDVLVTDEDMAQVRYRPCMHLILWPKSEIDEVVEATSQQIADGCHTQSKFPHELEATFPWLKVENSDVCLGTHGLQDEALYDPIGLRNLYRTLAQAYGANFIQAEFVDFNTQHNTNIDYIHPLSAGSLVARQTNGELKATYFSKVLLCSGHSLPFLESLSELEPIYRDTIQDLHFIQPKLRICLIFKSLMAPVINFPVITDTDGSMLMRDDYAGGFKLYLNQEESEKFFYQDNARFMDLESNEPYVNLYHKPKYFDDYFINTVKPRLVKRIPVMEDAELILAQSGFESYNNHDGNPVLSCHPYHEKVMICGGFGNRLGNFGPIAGAACSELLLYHEESTFDCTNFYWDRVLKGRTVEEFNSILGKESSH